MITVIAMITAIVVITTIAVITSCARTGDLRPHLETLSFGRNPVPARQCEAYGIKVLFPGREIPPYASPLRQLRRLRRFRHACGRGEGMDAAP